MVGRPKKYKTKKQLSEAVERYFSSISKVVTVYDEIGAVMIGDDCNIMQRVEYIDPPTITGLCLYLGIDRRTWANYCDIELHPEFADVTAYARARIEAWLERELLTREKSVQGLIFNLQNNFGWRQKAEVDLGEKTRKTIAETEKMSLADKIAAIAQAADALKELSDEDEA